MSAQFIFLDHTVQWATVHWFFRAVSRMKKGMSQDSSNEKLGPSSFFRVANPVTAWPSFLYPPSQVSCKQQYIIQQETFQDTLNLWLNFKNSLITVRFHLWQLGLLIHHQKFIFFCPKHKMMVCLNVGSMNLLYSKFKFHRKTWYFRIYLIFLIETVRPIHKLQHGTQLLLYLWTPLAMYMAT